MASFLKGLDEYWRDTDDTYQKLVESKPRPKAVVFKYELKKAIDKPTEKNTSGTPLAVLGCPFNSDGNPAGGNPPNGNGCANRRTVAQSSSVTSERKKER